MTRHLSSIIYIVTCFLIAVVPIGVKAQIDVTGRPINVDNGLPDNNVRSIAQDDDGFIWFGSLYGLYRFDGSRYLHFNKEDTENGRLLPSNHIKGVRNIGHSNLLITTTGDKLVLFNTDQYRFEPVSQEILSELALNTKVPNQITDNLGNKIAYSNGTIHYGQVGNRDKEFELKVISDDMLRLHDDYKVNVITTPQDLVWISTNGNGVFVYDLNKKSYRHLTHENSPSFMSSNFVVDLSLSQDGVIWLAFNRLGVARLESEKARCEIINMGPQNDLNNSNEIKLLTCLSDSVILVANDAGRICRLTPELNLVPPPSEFPQGLEYLTAGITPGKEIWIGTRSSGLLIDGVSYKHDSKNPLSIGSNRVYTATCDLQGRLWIGGQESLVDLAEKKDDTFIFRHFGEKMGDFTVQSMITDHLGNIWVATSKGLVTFNPDSLIINPHSYIKYSLAQVPGEEVRVNSILEDRQARIWIGTADKGLYYSHSPSDPQRNQYEFRRLKSNQLTAEHIQVLASDEKDNLWIGTDNGLYYFNKEAESFAYLRFESSQLRNIYQINCVAPLSGRFAFGTVDGIIVVDEEDIMKKEPTRDLLITEIDINGEPFELNARSTGGIIQPGEDDVLHLKSDERSLTIYFSDLSYKNGTRYSYILEGYDKQWIAAGNLNFASYRNLGYGSYTFKVRSTSSSGVVHEQSLKIHIDYPWYDSWWFITLMVITGLGIIYIIYRYRRHINLLKKNSAEQKMSTEYRMKFFTNISHEFRTPLTLMQVSVDKLLGNRDLPQNLQFSTNIMKKNVERMKRLIDQLMEFRRMENNRLELRLEKTDVVAFVNNIWQAFRDSAESRDISYKFQSSEKSHEMYIDKGYVDKIIYNLLSNAFKYTPTGGTISLEISFTEQDIVIEVSDNGIGVPAEKRKDLFKRFNHSMINGDSMGIGLNLTAELVQTHKGTITFRDTENQPSGSTFRVTLPLDKTLFKPEEFMYTIPPSKEEEDVNFGDLVIVDNPTPLNEYNVLIVEDDRDIQDFLEAELSRYFHVRTANDGQEAITMIENQLPDLVITDYMMPNMDGIELLKHIRSGSYRYLPVIFLTAVDTVEGRIKGLSAGADVYMAKPFSTHELIVQCVNILQRQNQLKSSFSQTADDTKVKIPELITEERDKDFLNQLDEYINEHIHETDLNIDRLAKVMGYGRTKFYQKMTSVVGSSPKEYIRRKRIEKAAELLRDEKITVAEVSYKVGIGTPQYLTTVFKSYYGVTPSQYQQNGSKKE